MWEISSVVFLRFECLNVKKSKDLYCTTTYRVGQLKASPRLIVLGWCSERRLGFTVRKPNPNQHCLGLHLTFSGL